MKHIIIVVTFFLVTPTISISMEEKEKKSVQELAIIPSFFPQVSSIAVIKKVMDKIEQEKLGYLDYSGRTGGIWSTHKITTSEPADIVETYETRTTAMHGSVKKTPESLLNYLETQAIFLNEVLPKMFEQMRQWREIPEKVYADIFLQRCNASEPMEWHQDLGDQFDPQANYSLLVYLSHHNDPKSGWTGGEFKIRPGLPEDKCDEANVQTFIPQYNQGILFNNQINNHSVTAVTPNGKDSKRDLIVVAVHLKQLMKRITQKSTT